MKKLIEVCEWPTTDAVNVCGAPATVLVGDSRPYCTKHSQMVQSLRDAAQSGRFAPVQEMVA
jgi:hypothetical protein